MTAIRFTRARDLSRSTGGSALRSATYNTCEAIAVEPGGTRFVFAYTDRNVDALKADRNRHPVPHSRPVRSRRRPPGPRDRGEAAALASYLRDLARPHGGAVNIVRGVSVPARLRAGITLEPDASVHVSDAV